MISGGKTKIYFYLEGNSNVWLEDHSINSWTTTVMSGGQTTIFFSRKTTVKSGRKTTVIYSQKKTVMYGGKTTVIYSWKTTVMFGGKTTVINRPSVAGAVL